MCTWQFLPTLIKYHCVHASQSCFNGVTIPTSTNICIRSFTNIKSETHAACKKFHLKNKFIHSPHSKHILPCIYIHTGRSMSIRTYVQTCIFICHHPHHQVFNHATSYLIWSLVWNLYVVFNVTSSFPAENWWTFIQVVLHKLFFQCHLINNGRRTQILHNIQ